MLIPRKGAHRGGSPPARSRPRGRRVVVAVEILEDRFLLADLLAPTPPPIVQILPNGPLPAANVSDAITVTIGGQSHPNVILTSGGDSLHWVVDPAHPQIEITVTWSSLSPFGGGSLIVVDSTGQSLLNQAIATGTTSVTLLIQAQDATPQDPLFVELVPPSNASSSGQPPPVYVLKFANALSWQWQTPLSGNSAGSANVFFGPTPVSGTVISPISVPPSASSSYWVTIGGVFTPSTPPKVPSAPTTPTAALPTAAQSDTLVTARLPSARGAPIGGIFDPNQGTMNVARGGEAVVVDAVLAELPHTAWNLPPPLGPLVKADAPPRAHDDEPPQVSPLLLGLAWMVSPRLALAVVAQPPGTSDPDAPAATPQTGSDLPEMAVRRGPDAGRSTGSLPRARRGTAPAVEPERAQLPNLDESPAEVRQPSSPQVAQGPPTDSESTSGALSPAIAREIAELNGVELIRPYWPGWGVVLAVLYGAFCGLLKGTAPDLALRRRPGFQPVGGDSPPVPIPPRRRWK
jgi:hypothetical protein